MPSPPPPGVHPLSSAGLCPQHVAQPGAGMSSHPWPCSLLHPGAPKTFPFSSPSPPSLRALPVPCQRKRLRYSDLDFEVSPTTATGATGARHGVGCHLVTEPSWPWFALSAKQQPNLEEFLYQTTTSISSQFKRQRRACRSPAAPARGLGVPREGRGWLGVEVHAKVCRATLDADDRGLCSRPAEGDAHAEASLRALP